RIAVGKIARGHVPEAPRDEPRPGRDRKDVDRGNPWAERTRPMPQLTDMATGSADDRAATRGDSRRGRFVRRDLVVGSRAVEGGRRERPPPRHPGARADRAIDISLGAELLVGEDYGTPRDAEVGC